MNAWRTLLVAVFFLSICAVQSAVADVGELDASFGQDGRMATALGNYGDQAYAVRIQPDGKILVAGSSANGADLDFALVRYYPDGSFDETFNGNGAVTTLIGRDDDEIAAIALQDDGYIVAAGYAVNNGSKDFALARYTPDGLLDYSFGTGGVVMTEFSTLDDELTAVTIDRQGRIVAAGYTTGTSGRALLVARYLPGGAPDPAFGYQGVSLVGIGSDALARDIILDRQGRILLTGSYSEEDHTALMVLRFDEAGELDNGFGTEGMAVPADNPALTEGFAIALHGETGILVAGSVGEPGELDSALFRFTGSGQPDLRFGSNGLLITEASQQDDMALAVDVQGDAICLSGFAAANEGRQFLYIYHQVTVSEADSVSFAMDTAGGATSLNIGQRQDLGSYEEYQGYGDVSIMPERTIVNTTPFGYLSNDISYAVAIQPDGKAVAAGVSGDQYGQHTIALARYTAAEPELTDPEVNAGGSAAGASWIVTKEPSEVRRTSAFSGGIIFDSGRTIDQRGVVFSIAPDPVVRDGGSDAGDPGDPVDPGDPGDDTSPPAVSSTVPTDGASGVAVDSQSTINWDESIDCATVTTSSVTIDPSSNLTQSSCSGSQAIFTTSGQAADTTYQVTVSDTVADLAGNQMSSAYSFSYTTATSSARTTGNWQRVEQYASTVSGLLIPSAHAQDSTGTGTTDTGDSGSSSSSGVFSLSSPAYILEGQTSDGAGTGSYSSILENLKPGTFYYVRAYAITSGGDIFYGNQIGIKTPDSCFIATAAYGSLLHPFVSLLRDFRDQYLMTNSIGRKLVTLYYQYSPPIAETISSHPGLRPLVQVLLLPVVGLGWLVMHIGVFGFCLLAVMGILPLWLRKRFR
jgi:uncharacterized delta-60 repeat protein